MNETYKHHYTDIDKFLVFEYDEHNRVIRIIDNPEHYSPYQEWIKKNTPAKVAWDRFVSIVDGNVIINENKDAILEAERKINLASTYKNNARQQIEKQVGDDKDLVADISKRLDIIERGLVRLLAHVLGGTQMSEEYQTRYLNYAETLLNLVDNSLYVPRADLENEDLLVAKIIERQNAIGQIVKTEYLDKLKNEGLSEG